jgi:hypothetical protein
MKLLIITFVFFLTSCGSVRIFEDRVPDPIRKNQIHLDKEKQGAYYLAVNAKNENKDVANALSRSIGTPSKIEDNPKTIVESLFSFTSNYEGKISNLNQELETLQGKDIEGTGFNIMPYTSTLGIVVICILLVLFPSAITILFFILKRTRNAFSNIVKGVQEFTKNNPGNAKDLNEVLEKKMDRVEKALKTKYETYG